jgi:hypothetical protein
MKQMSLTTVVIGASTFACAALLTLSWSEQCGVSLSVESAQARVGRPLSPVSVAGVARRQTRRGAYGVGAVGVGAAAVGTAAAVAATSPNWGWGSGPYTGAGYNAGGPYYRGGVLGARAAYYGGGYGNNYGSYGAYSGGDTEAVAYCTERFRSYDPASGSYLGYDGLRHACP